MLVSVVIPILALAIALLALAWFARHWFRVHVMERQTEPQRPSLTPLPYPNERRILDNLNAVPWEWDLTEGRYTFIGKKVESLLGYPVEAWYESKIWRESLHPEDIGLVEGSFMRAVWAGGRNTYRYRVIHRDGSIRRVESDISTLLEGASPALSAAPPAWSKTRTDAELRSKVRMRRDGSTKKSDRQDAKRHRLSVVRARRAGLRC